MLSAKTVMGWKLHESLGARHRRSARLAECERDASAARRCAAEGCELNEDFAYVSGVLTSSAKLTAEEIDLKISRVTARIVKDRHIMDRYPSELAGGQQQRVAIARTLSRRSRPCCSRTSRSNLDAQAQAWRCAPVQSLHIDTGSTLFTSRTTRWRP